MSPHTTTASGVTLTAGTPGVLGPAAEEGPQPATSPPPPTALVARPLRVARLLLLLHLLLHLLEEVGHLHLLVVPEAVALREGRRTDLIRHRASTPSTLLLLSSAIVQDNLTVWIKSTSSLHNS